VHPVQCFEVNAALLIVRMASTSFPGLRYDKWHQHEPEEHKQKDSHKISKKLGRLNRHEGQSLFVQQELPNGTKGKSPQEEQEPTYNCGISTASAIPTYRQRYAYPNDGQKDPARIHLRLTLHSASHSN
jgi:hypothetical protein